jgi:hypothetical protein
MLEFTVKHKYCGMEKKIKGQNVWQAFKNNNLDINIWQVIDVRSFVIV